MGNSSSTPYQRVGEIIPAIPETGQFINNVLAVFEPYKQTKPEVKKSVWQRFCLFCCGAYEEENVLELECKALTGGLESSNTAEEFQQSCVTQLRNLYSKILKMKQSLSSAQIIVVANAINGALREAVGPINFLADGGVSETHLGKLSPADIDEIKQSCHFIEIIEAIQKKISPYFRYGVGSSAGVYVTHNGGGGGFGGYQ